MTYQFLLEFLSNTIKYLGIQEENRIFKLTLDRNSYCILNNDLGKFTDEYTKFKLEKLSTKLGIVYIECLDNKLEPYIKLELK